MMRYAWVAALLFFCSVGVCRESEKEEKCVRFENDKKTADLGTLELKEKRTAVFRFVNETGGPLVITAGETSCGCTRVSYNKKPVKPQAKDSIVVTYDAKETGAFYKKVTIKSNAPEGDIVLSVKGTVK